MGNVKNRPGQFGELYSDAIKSGRIIKTNKNDMHAQQHAAARPDFPDFLRTGRGGAPPPCSGGAGLRPSTRARARARALSTRQEFLTYHHFQRKENKSRCSSFFLQNSCFRDPPVFLLSHMAWYKYVIWCGFHSFEIDDSSFVSSYQGISKVIESCNCDVMHFFAPLKSIIHHVFLVSTCFNRS